MPKALLPFQNTLLPSSLPQYTLSIALAALLPPFPHQRRTNTISFPLHLVLNRTHHLPIVVVVFFGHCLLSSPKCLGQPPCKTSTPTLARRRRRSAVRPALVRAVTAVPRRRRRCRFASSRSLCRRDRRRRLRFHAIGQSVAHGGGFWPGRRRRCRSCLHWRCPGCYRLGHVLLHVCRRDPAGCRAVQSLS